MNGTPELHFYYDVVCPFAYVASKRVEVLARAVGAEVVWRPILLGGVLQAVGAPTDPASEMPPQKARYTQQDAYRQAERAGFTIRYPDDHPRRTVDAMRLLVATPEAFRPALSADLFDAYWVHQQDLSDLEVLQQIASRHGLDARVIKEPAIREALRDATDEAIEAGVFGVPTFKLDDELWWGADRLHFALRRLGGLPPQPTWMDEPRLSRVTYFHDFSSPFSYLASTRIEAFALDHGALLEWVPILVGALFKQVGTPTVPLNAMNPRRADYQRRDLEEWAEHWGVPFTFTNHFPLHSVQALRVSLQEPAAVQPIYRAAWVENADIGDEDVLQRVLDNAGLPGLALLKGARDPAIKQKLRDNTDRAFAAGAFGVPTFIVDDEVMFWGQDRFDMVEAALGGWRPRNG